MFLLNRTFYHFSQSTLTNIHRVLIGQEVGSVPDIFFGPNSWQLAFCTRITLPWHYEEANLSHAHSSDLKKNSGGYYIS